jgi:hypothetical protein
MSLMMMRRRGGGGGVGTRSHLSRWKKSPNNNMIPKYQNIIVMTIRKK